MRNEWMMTGALLALSASALLGAQAQTTTAEKDGRVTVTGCLTAESPAGGAVGTSGSAGATAGANRADASGNGTYRLINAKFGGAPGGGSGVTSIAPAGSGTNEQAVRTGNTPPSPALSGAIGTNGEPSGADSHTFTLRGDFPELPRHVGQEVEISGKMAGTAGAASSTGTSTADSQRAAGTSSTQAIEVTSIRMIASVCAAH